MSHIDSFKHEIVGMFGPIAVYHPLEDIGGDFTCGPDSIVIGGGSGEWPAIVVKNPNAAVATFLATELQSDELKRVKDEWLEIIRPHYDFAQDKIIEFSRWLVSDYAEFQKICCASVMQNQFDSDSHNRGLEDWLICGIGEFIFYAMPELAPAIMSKLENPYSYFGHIRYNNIMLIPPNMPVYANGGNAFFSPKRTYQ